MAEPADPGLIEYYRRRAAGYEAIFAKPERQADLALLRKEVGESFSGKTVLEIACGTGYWTVVMAERAERILATDYSEEPMRIAQAKSYPRNNVAFRLADAYALPEELGRFDAAFAGFWWSHVPRARLGGFLASLHARLEPGSRVVMLDNRYVEGSSTPIAETDEAGDSFQLRRLADGTTSRVLKNFPEEAELRLHIGPHASSFRYRALQYYWVVDYRLK